MGGSDREL